MTFRFYANPAILPATPEPPDPALNVVTTPPVAQPGAQETTPVTTPVAPVPAATSATPVTVPTPKPIDASAYLGGLLATPAPAPKYDTTSEDYLKKLAKYNQLGNFLTLLSDVAGVSMGAPVQSRQFKSSAPYLQAILENRAKFEADKQNYQTQEYNRKLQNAQHMADQQWQQQKFTEQQQQNAEQFKTRMDIESEKLGMAKQKAEEDKNYRDWLKQNKKEDTAFQRKKFADESARGWAGINAREESSKTGPVKVQTATKTYELPREEFNRYTEEAFSDPELRIAHPEWFSKTGEQQVYNPQTNQIELKGGREILNPTVKPEFLVKYWLEKKEKQTKNPASVSPAPAAATSGTSTTKPKLFQPKSKLVY